MSLEATPAELLEVIVMYYLQEGCGLTPHNLAELIPGSRAGQIQNLLMEATIPGVELVDRARLIYEPSKAMLAKLARHLWDLHQLTSSEVRAILMAEAA